MKPSSVWIARALLGVGTALWLHLAPARAESPPPPRAGAEVLFHSQQALAELQHRLELAPSQQAAWEGWSGAELQALKDTVARQQAWVAAQREAAPIHPDGLWSTPEQMAWHIARLRDHKYWLDQQLLQLQAQQLRTQAFYDTLDGKQKSIFDLFLRQASPAGPGMGWPPGSVGPHPLRMPGPARVH